MKVIKMIISESEYSSAEKMEVGDSIEIDGVTFMDLTIEKIGDEKLSVAHYYTQRGDLMSDPEIVFKITDESWVPVRYTSHPGVHQYSEFGLGQDVRDFIEEWNINLLSQGFLELFTEIEE